MSDQGQGQAQDENGPRCPVCGRVAASKTETADRTVYYHHGDGGLVTARHVVEKAERQLRVTGGGA